MEITIITASYNCAKYLEETIQSVLAQTYKNWNLIIFDDGSSDGSPDIARQFCAADKRIKLLRHPEGKNLGLAATLKKAVSCAKTEYIAFLECDDIWDKNYLKEKVSLISQNPAAGIVYNAAQPFGVPSRVKKLSLYYKAGAIYTNIINCWKIKQNLSFPLLSFNPVPGFSCVMLRAELFEKLDFSPAIPTWLDYWLWTQLAMQNSFYFIPKPLTKWRLTSASFTMRNLPEAKKNERLFRTQAAEVYIKNWGKTKYILLSSLSVILNCFLAILFFIPKHIIKLFIRG